MLKLQTTRSIYGGSFSGDPVRNSNPHQHFLTMFSFGACLKDYVTCEAFAC